MTLQSVAISKDDLRNTILVPARVLIKITEILFNEEAVEVERTDFAGGADFDVTLIASAKFMFTVTVREAHASFSVLDKNGAVMCRGTSHVELIEFLQNQGACICDDFIVNLLSQQ